MDIVPPPPPPQISRPWAIYAQAERAVVGRTFARCIEKLEKKRELLLFLARNENKKLDETERGARRTQALKERRRLLAALYIADAANVRTNDTPADFHWK